MTATRASGLFFVLFGLALYFAIIPYDTEMVDYGWVRPQTVPNAMAWIMIACGALLALRPGAGIEVDWPKMPRAALFFAIIAIGLGLTSVVGFKAAAPVLALTLMLVIGERRPLWLAGGAILLPLALWIGVELLLDRQLP